MADMDLEELDGLPQASTKSSRFAPKNAKFKPQPKSRPKAEAASSEIVHESVQKKEELDLKPALFDSSSIKGKHECEPSTVSDAVKMDVDEEGEGQKEAMEVDNDQDEVVREIDVYFNPSIDPNTQLYVLQYPLRPLWRPYELEERCDEVRVKPTSSEVEIDLTVDVESKNYDRDHNNQMTKQTLSSSWMPPRKSGYAVGVLMGNKLHLNPIHAVVQLRPLMRDLQPGGPVQKNIEGKVEELHEEKPLGSSKKQHKPLGVLNDQKKDTEESWVPLKYHGSKSVVAAECTQKMVAKEISPVQFSMTIYDYVNSLCHGASNDNIGQRGPPRRILSMPLEERYRTWLREGPAVQRFNALKHLAPDESTKDVLRILLKYAHVVQGLWVPKSSVLYEKDTGVEVLARNYILLLFSKSPVIKNTQLPQKPELVKVMRDVLHVLAVERPSFGDWKFKEPVDISFIKSNLDIVKEQEKAWEPVEKTITGFIFGGRNPPNVKNFSKPNTTNRAVAPNTSIKGLPKTPHGTLSRVSMSDETREALPKALQKVFQAYPVCSFRRICQGLREVAVSESFRPKVVDREAIEAAIGAEAPQELLAIINQVATNIHGVYVSKSSPDHPQYDGLRKVVIDLLIAEGPNAKLKKASIVEAARMQLKREITPNEYQKVLSELCESKASAWVLKSGDGKPR